MVEEEEDTREEVEEAEEETREEAQDTRVHKEEEVAVEITVETEDQSLDRVALDRRQAAEEEVLAVQDIPVEDQQGLDSIQLHRNNGRVSNLETHTCHPLITHKCPLLDQVAMETSVPNRDTIINRECKLIVFALIIRNKGFVNTK